MQLLNQKVILSKYAKENHFPNPTFFVDDGFSGTNFERPGWNDMLEQIEAGKVKTIVHISYDLVGILPELNNPMHEEMA